jgi:uncharacterized repeat protein (TIGR03803 family)
MRGNRFSVGLRVTPAVLAVILLVTGTCAANQETVLHNFNNDGKDGNYPNASLIFDASGNLYGTSTGGEHGYGTVFELMPKTGGGWTETVLHDFNNDGKDGIFPYAKLIFDGAGNLYGTTYYGGLHNGGTVFELKPATGGGWTETVIHNFNDNGVDGLFPYAAVIFDGAGNLYGTTSYGGVHGRGTLFELTPGGRGWTEKVLHSFNDNGKDGFLPSASLIFDGAGNLYGTTYNGGAYGYGTVFELTPKTGGGWAESVLHDFSNSSGDGIFPYASLIFDGSGNLYGTTYNGGIHAGGTVFELTPAGSGRWNEKVLHNFDNNGRDGDLPLASLIFDGAGNLYGTTYYGGAYGCGIAFELTPTVGGGWNEQVLHAFNDNGKDASNPSASLILDAAANLYGTTQFGGGHDYGAVFEITP